MMTRYLSIEDVTPFRQGYYRVGFGLVVVDSPTHKASKSRSVVHMLVNPQQVAFICSTIGVMSMEKCVGKLLNAPSLKYFAFEFIRYALFCFFMFKDLTSISKVPCIYTPD